MKFNLKRFIHKKRKKSHKENLKIKNLIMKLKMMIGIFLLNFIDFCFGKFVRSPSQPKIFYYVCSLLESTLNLKLSKSWWKEFWIFARYSEPYVKGKSQSINISRLSRFPCWLFFLTMFSELEIKSDNIKERQIKRLKLSTVSTCE